MTFMRKILLVDYQPRVSAMVRQALEASGEYLIKEEHDSRCAVSAARFFQPDLILFDVEMTRPAAGKVARELQTDPLLNETLSLIGWVTRLNADSCPGPDKVGELRAIEHWFHAEGRQQPCIEGPSPGVIAHGQHDVRHTIDVDFHVVPPANKVGLRRSLGSSSEAQSFILLRSLWNLAVDSSRIFCESPLRVHAMEGERP